MSNYLEVTGRGEAGAIPDVVVVQARVEHDAAGVAEALDECARRVSAAFEAAAEHGIAATDRRTVTIGVRQRWDREGSAVVGHTAFQGIRLVCRERARVGDLLTALVAAAGDGLRVEGVTLELADSSAVAARAREAAVADAQAKAEHLARLAGRSLGPVTRIIELSGADREPGPQPRMYAARADAAPASMPIEGGESTVSASVRTRWSLAKSSSARPTGGLTN